MRILLIANKIPYPPKDGGSIATLNMGTPEFAAESLRQIAHSNHKLLAVVTVPDKPAGRGQKLKQSEVKIEAERLNLPILQPEKLKDPDFINELHRLNPDIIVVVAFRMLPRDVWSIPKIGTFNLHERGKLEYFE